MADQQQHYIPPGILIDFANENNVTPEEAGPLLVERVKHIVDIYSSNGAMAFWSNSDLQALHVALSNHLLNANDTDASIEDVDIYQSVYVHLDEWLTAWITEKKRKAFDESVRRVSELDSKKKEALLGALLVAVSMIDAESPQDTPDDAALFDIVKRAAATEAKPGWAKLRLQMVADILSGKVQEAAQEVKQANTNLPGAPKPMLPPPNEELTGVEMAENKAQSPQGVSLLSILRRTRT
jgi:hypothetical protein